MKKLSFLGNSFKYLNKKRSPRFLDEKQLFLNGPVTYKVIATVIGIFIATVSLIAIARVNDELLVKIPSHGGTLHEGIIGTPRYINPVLAISASDKDLTTLVYAGLMKKTRDGKLEPELATGYTLSDDGTVYTFNLKEGIYFHDGVSITAEDIAFTIQQVQDPAVNSPILGNWTGVNVKVISTHQIQFVLNEPYAPFLHNTTLGILPKHLWENTSPEQFALNSFNVEPIGSGPYKIQEIKRKNGLPELFRLTPSGNYPLGEPYIKDLIIHVFQEEDQLMRALVKGDIDSASGISSDVVSELDEDVFDIVSTPLPRIFYVYLNQNKADVFTEDGVRKALNHTINRDTLVKYVFNGYASSVFGPLPPNPFISNPEVIETGKEFAIELLENNGWTIDGATSTIRMKGDTPLTFRLATSNHPELKKSAEIIAGQFADIGVNVELEFYDIQDLKQNIIRPREFQALLFGALVDSELDLYPLWHSSQRNDPGLNISQYTNIDADGYLEKARSTTNKDARLEALRKSIEEIQKDTPVLPLFSPHLIYIRPQHVKNNKINYIEEQHDRFIDIHEWYVETRSIWKTFSN